MEAGCTTFAWIKTLKDATKRASSASATRIREDGAYIEAGENDNLIVQKLEANPNAVGIFGYSFLEENQDKLAGQPCRRRVAEVRDDRLRQVPGLAPAVHLREEGARRRDPRHPRVRGRVHERLGDGESATWRTRA